VSRSKTTDLPSAKRLFGKAMRDARHRRGLSQEALADEAGVHRTYVSLLERGLKSPTLDVILKMARVLDVSAAKLIADVENGLSESPSS